MKFEKSVFEIILATWRRDEPRAPAGGR